MHLSRLCEEIIIFASQEYKFVELSDDFTTGSSIMPQKKNCDFAELIKGRTGRMYGYLQAMLTMMKGIPLAYDKDMQEDKFLSYETEHNEGNGPNGPQDENQYQTNLSSSFQWFLNRNRYG